MTVGSYADADKDMPSDRGEPIKPAGSDIEWEKLELDRRRYFLEEQRERRECRWWFRNSGSVVAVSISAIATIVIGWAAHSVSRSQNKIAAAQVDVAKSQRDLSKSVADVDRDMKERDLRHKLASLLVEQQPKIVDEHGHLRCGSTRILTTFYGLTEIEKAYGSDNVRSACAQEAAISGTPDGSARGPLGTQLFPVITENRHAFPPDRQIATGTISMSDPRARIVSVEYSCVHVRCGWSYNPDPGKAYQADITISPDRKSFTWRRRWDGDPVIENYKVTYELAPN